MAIGNGKFKAGEDLLVFPNKILGFYPSDKMGLIVLLESGITIPVNQSVEDITSAIQEAQKGGK
jgi:hypothetical protein